MEFKAQKVAEDKESKSKEKMLIKKIKNLEEDKAKAIIATNRIKRDLNQNKVSKDSKLSQTEFAENSAKESQTEPSTDSPYEIDLHFHPSSVQIFVESLPPLNSSPDHSQTSAPSSGSPPTPTSWTRPKSFFPTSMTT